MKGTKPTVVDVAERPSSKTKTCELVHTKSVLSKDRVKKRKLESPGSKSPKDRSRGSLKPKSKERSVTKKPPKQIESGKEEESENLDISDHLEPDKKRTRTEDYKTAITKKASPILEESRLYKADGSCINESESESESFQSCSEENDSNTAEGVLSSPGREQRDSDSQINEPESGNDKSGASTTGSEKAGSDIEDDSMTESMAVNETKDDIDCSSIATNGDSDSDDGDVQYPKRTLGSMNNRAAGKEQRRKKPYYQKKRETTREPVNEEESVALAESMLRTRAVVIVNKLSESTIRSYMVRQKTIAKPTVSDPVLDHKKSFYSTKKQLQKLTEENTSGKIKKDLKLFQQKPAVEETEAHVSSPQREKRMMPKKVETCTTQRKGLKVKKLTAEELALAMMATKKCENAGKNNVHTPVKESKTLQHEQQSASKLLNKLEPNISVDSGHLPLSRADVKASAKKEVKSEKQLSKESINEVKPESKILDKTKYTAALKDKATPLKNVAKLGGPKSNEVKNLPLEEAVSKMSDNNDATEKETALVFKHSEKVAVPEVPKSKEPELNAGLPSSAKLKPKEDVRVDETPDGNHSSQTKKAENGDILKKASKKLGPLSARKADKLKSNKTPLSGKPEVKQSTETDDAFPKVTVETAQNGDQDMDIELKEPVSLTPQEEPDQSEDSQTGAPKATEQSTGNAEPQEAALKMSTNEVVSTEERPKQQEKDAIIQVPEKYEKPAVVKIDALASNKKKRKIGPLSARKSVSVPKQELNEESKSKVNPKSFQKVMLITETKISTLSPKMGPKSRKVNLAAVEKPKDAVESKISEPQKPSEIETSESKETVEFCSTKTSKRVDHEALVDTLAMDTSVVNFAPPEPADSVPSSSDKLAVSQQDGGSNNEPPQESKDDAVPGQELAVADTTIVKSAKASPLTNALSFKASENLKETSKKVDNSPLRKDLEQPSAQKSKVKAGPLSNRRSLNLGPKSKRVKTEATVTKTFEIEVCPAEAMDTSLNQVPEPVLSKPEAPTKVQNEEILENKRFLKLGSVITSEENDTTSSAQAQEDNLKADQNKISSTVKKTPSSTKKTKPHSARESEETEIISFEIIQSPLPTESKQADSKDSGESSFQVVGCFMPRSEPEITEDSKILKVETNASSSGSPKLKAAKDLMTADTMEAAASMVSTVALDAVVKKAEDVPNMSQLLSIVKVTIRECLDQFKSELLQELSSRNL